MSATLAEGREDGGGAGGAFAAQTAIGEVVNQDLVVGVRPSGWTDSSGRFDPLPGVLILELRGAEIAER